MKILLILYLLFIRLLILSLNLNYIKSLKLIDCFLFSNEIQMLYFRLLELYNAIDYFIIVESTLTFSGNEKKLFYYELKDTLFKPFNNKIIYVIVDDMPYDKHINYNNIANETELEFAWYREYYQRNNIIKGINKISHLLNNNDLIFISDLDEIPDINILKRWKLNEVEINEILYLRLHNYKYNLECRLVHDQHISYVISYEMYKNALKEKYHNNYYYNNDYYNNYPTFLQDYRMIPYNKSITSLFVLDGGWHFSYFGDLYSIVNKIENFAHQEFNNNYYKNITRLSQLIQLNFDIFDRVYENGIKDVCYNKTKLENNIFMPYYVSLLIPLQQFGN